MQFQSKYAKTSIKDTIVGVIYLFIYLQKYRNYN